MRANGRSLSGARIRSCPPARANWKSIFRPLTFIAPQKVRFRYQLEGYDQDWVEAKDRRVAFYTNLKPGRYKFHVIAANADGVWNNLGDSLEIELRPHYYQTAWFDALCGAPGVRRPRSASSPGASATCAANRRNCKKPVSFWKLKF